MKYLGTVRARLGYAAFDRALIYAHGGFAYGETDQEVRAGGTTLFDDSTSKAGWTIGAGLEYALTDHLSFQTEYSYVDLGEDDVFSGGGITVSEDLKFHAVKAAVNYRF